MEPGQLWDHLYPGSLEIRSPTGMSSFLHTREDTIALNSMEGDNWAWQDIRHNMTQCKREKELLMHEDKIKI